MDAMEKEVSDAGFKVMFTLKFYFLDILVLPSCFKSHNEPPNIYKMN